MRTLLAGVLLGFVVTVILVMVLPRRWGHWRAVFAALVGFIVVVLVDLLL